MRRMAELGGIGLEIASANEWNLAVEKVVQRGGFLIEIGSEYLGIEMTLQVIAAKTSEAKCTLARLSEKIDPYWDRLIGRRCSTNLP